MSKQNKPIEDLFKDAFEHFEKTPSNSVWSGIQAGINAPVAGATAVAKGAMSIGAKIGIAVATVGVIATTLYVGFINTDEEKTTIAQQEVATQQENEVISAVEEETNSAEITTREIEIAELEKSGSADKNQANSSTGSSAREAKATTAQINQSTVKVADNSKQKIETTTAPVENANNNAAISGNKETNSVQEVADNKTSEIVQETKKEAEETTALSAIINVNHVNGEVPFQLAFNTPEEADTYVWKLNGLTISNSKNSSIEVTSTGTQKLELTVIKGDKTAQSIQIIDAKKSSITAIQNIFTPNQDGMNDVFRIEEGFDQLSVKILDQNYKELHNWIGEYGFWDGTYPDGSMAPNGVYFYMGTYKKNGKEETLKGSVTLRR